MKNLWVWLDTFSVTFHFGGFEINGVTIIMPIPHEIKANRTAKIVMICFALICLASVAAFILAGVKA